jgi:hypothetical protein
LSEDEGIKAVVGKLKGEDKTSVQSYLFDKSKSWNVEKAKAWFEKHNEAVVKERVSAILPFKVLEKIVDKPLRIKGIAMTAGMSRNFNIYTPEELQAFAQKLVSAPVYIEHVAVPNAVGKVTKTEFDGQNLWYEAEIYDDETAEKIRKGLIQHVSVGADYETLDVLDGKVPHGLHNAELSLVAVPGIPDTSVQVLEKLQQSSKADKKQVDGKPRKFVAERVWTRKYINDLPDSAFAIILPGGHKDSEGKTVPRSLRKFPHHNAEGGIDLPHLRNANARLPQSDLTAEQKEQAMRHLAAHKKKLGIGMSAEEAKLVEQEPEGEIEFEASPEPTMDELIASIEDVIEQINSTIEGLETRIQKLEQPQAAERVPQLQHQNIEANVKESLVQKPKEPMIPVSEAIKILESLLPSPAVEHSTLGMQRMCQDIRRAIWKLKERTA